VTQHLIRTVKQLEKAIKVLSSCKVLAHDTETTGLYPYHGDYAFSHIFANATDEYYFDFSRIPRKHARKLQPILDDPSRIIFYINAKFDVAISRNDGLKFHCKLVDVPALARVEYNKHKANQGDSFLSMDYLAEHYLDRRKDDKVKAYVKEHGLYKTDAMGDEQALDYAAVPIKLIFPYACQDGRLTYDLGMRVSQLINEKADEYAEANPYNKTMVDLCKNEIAFTKVLCNIQRTGMLCDVPYTKRAYKHELRVSETSTAEVRKIIGSKFNPNSPKQISAYVMGKLGLQLPKKMVKKPGTYKKIWKGNYKTDEDTLAALNVPILNTLIKAKKAQKKANTYYSNFLKFKDSKNIVHCNLHQETAKTGRTSSSKPNFQNMAKDDV